MDVSHEASASTLEACDLLRTDLLLFGAGSSEASGDLVTASEARERAPARDLEVDDFSLYDPSPFTAVRDTFGESQFVKLIYRRNVFSVKFYIENSLNKTF